MRAGLRGSRNPILTLTPSPGVLVASPSRDSDSRMVLQVEAISEMDCHSSSSVSLPASDMTVGSRRQAQQGSPRNPSNPPGSTLTLADGVPKRQSPWQEGGPQFWGQVALVFVVTGAAWPFLGGKNEMSVQ